jgi:hypothetical protein
MKSYHRAIQGGILRYGAGRFPVVRGDNVPVHINHLTQKRQILYRPDATFTTRHGLVWVFEVLDDQMHDDNLIIADIIQAFMTPHVSHIYFIVPTPKDQDHVEDLAVTMYDRLVQMGMPPRSLRRVSTMFILRREASSARSVETLLRRAMSSPLPQRARRRGS